MNFIEHESSQKLRGGYYTPADLAAFLARWVGQTNPADILEPSCGDGVFLAALAASPAASQASIAAFELDPGEARSAAERADGLRLNAAVQATDFLGWALENLSPAGARFDAVVGNPPFIRYQYLPAAFQPRAADVFRRLGCAFTKHTNAWVPFVLASFALLRPGGRLAMVVPAEIIHVAHAQSLRSYLGEECRRLVIVDPERLWFEKTLQGAVLLLAEKRHDAADAPQGLGVVSVRDREFLSREPDELFAAPRPINGKTVAGKWTRALLDATTRGLLDEVLEHPAVHRFADIADVDVGIVTGANKYFLVADAVVNDRGLGDYAHPMFGRSEHCPGVIYDDAQHRANARYGHPTNFLWFKNAAAIQDAAVQAYVDIGERETLHTRFKCRVRSPWYAVPSVYATEVGMLKRAHDAPRLILNRAGAYTTDTAYRIRARAVAADHLVASFVNPLTALSAELEGRHYGGGVLELVPSEIERLALPISTTARPDLNALDRAMRTTAAVDILTTYGGEVLAGIGLSKAQQEQLLAGWMTLRNRRRRISPASHPES